MLQLLKQQAKNGEGPWLKDKLILQRGHVQLKLTFPWGQWFPVNPF